MENMDNKSKRFLDLTQDLSKEGRFRAQLQKINAGEEYGALTDEQIEMAVSLYTYAAKIIHNVDANGRMVNNVLGWIGDDIKKGEKPPMQRAIPCELFSENFRSMLAIGALSEEQIANYIGGNDPLMREAAKMTMRAIEEEKSGLKTLGPAGICMPSA